MFGCKLKKNRKRHSVPHLLFFQEDDSFLFSSSLPPRSTYLKAILAEWGRRLISLLFLSSCLFVFYCLYQFTSVSLSFPILLSFRPLVSFLYCLSSDSITLLSLSFYIWSFWILLFFFEYLFFFVSLSLSSILAVFLLLCLLIVLFVSLSSILYVCCLWFDVPFFV